MSRWIVKMVQVDLVEFLARFEKKYISILVSKRASFSTMHTGSKLRKQKMTISQKKLNRYDGF